MLCPWAGFASEIQNSLPLRRIYLSETPELKKKFDLPKRPKPGEARITKVKVKKVRRGGETRVMVARGVCRTKRETMDRNDRSRTPPRQKEEKAGECGHTALWTAHFCFVSFVQNMIPKYCQGGLQGGD